MRAPRITTLRQGELRKAEVFDEPQREGQGRVNRQPHGERLNQAVMTVSPSGHVVHGRAVL